MKKDIEMYGYVTVPKNFVSISRVETFFTSVRKPEDYPILSSRFKKKVKIIEEVVEDEIKSV